MSLSQNPSCSLYFVAVLAVVAQIIIWNSVSLFQPNSKKEVISSLFLLTLLCLPFSIFFNFSIIQLLWDVFIWSHSIHPYSITPTDPLIAKAQSALLFDYLPNKFEVTTTPVPLLIGLKPIFFLYKKIGLFGTLFSSKILLALIFAFFIDFTIPNKFKYFWLFNPIIWVFAISQADFTLLGFLSFGFGLYFYRQFEFQNAFFIWGLTALFGFEYVLLILFITSLEKKYNYLMYSIISSIIWVILIWDNQAIYSYFFISSEQQSLLYQFFPSLKEYNFYLSILLYFTLGTITIVSGLLLSQSDSNDIKKNNNSYFEWLRTKRNNLFLFSSILLILFIQNSFNYTLIWSFFAAISASQFYYLEHFNFNNN
ncbi:MAG: hypothetical protein GW809_09040 [Bacteroidetes bacterium]|nr:hypothetical protein [Bacteroidota bacterium]NCQ12265.1 hypothetical protein [Bacteroidota bacterium]